MASEKEWQQRMEEKYLLPEELRVDVNLQLATKCRLSLKKYGLSANERVKSRKDFELLYSEGKLVFSKNKKLKALYFIEHNSESPGVKIASAVSKKAGPAPWRNRIKRLIKEVYRLNKYILVDKSLAASINLKIIFSCHTLNQRNNRKITYHDMFPDIIELINKIGTEL